MVADSECQMAVYIAGYITQALIKDTSCDDCLHRLKEDQVTNSYLDTLNRGGLKLPSMSLHSYVQTAFCVIEDNPPGICSFGFPFKVLARRILDSLCMDWDSDFSCFANKEHSCKMVARMLFVCKTQEIRIPIHAK